MISRDNREFVFLFVNHQSIAVISSIYRSPAMVTVDVFLVSLFVGAERVCACEILDTHMCSEYISEAE